MDYILCICLCSLIPAVLHGRPVGIKDSQVGMVTGDTSDPTMPDMTMPGMTMPEMTMPEMTMPEMSMPEMPMTGMPEMPDMGDMKMMMQMYFYVGVNSTILFENWETSSWQQMLGSCIGIAIIACLYEGFKVAREVIHSGHQTNKGRGASKIYALDDKGFANHNNHNNTMFDEDGVQDGCCNPKVSICSGWHWLQTFLHVLQVLISYCLMLVFMTFNVWLCLAVCLGAGIGYYVFGWIKSSTSHDFNNEHCN